MTKLLVMKILIVCSHLLFVALGADNPSNETNVKTQVIDLNFDCLQSVCSFLNVTDLMNFAQANTELIEAATYEFRWHHADETIYISDRRKVELDQSFKPELKGFDMRWSAAKSNRTILNSTEAQTILPIFGESIKDLSIDFNQSEQPQELLDCVVETCSSTLISMKWQGISFPNPKLTKSFLKVENLVIEDSHLDENLLQFNKWFPMMKSLRLSGNKFIPYLYLELFIKPFPNLINFASDINLDEDDFVYSYFESLLKQNPQIRSVNIMKCYSKEFRGMFKFIHDTLPDLEELKWGVEVGVCAADRTRNGFLYKNLKKMEGYFPYWEDSYRLEQSLQHLSILTDHFYPTSSDRFSIFIKSNVNLTKLKISTKYGHRLEGLDIVDIISSLPKLNELYLYGYILDLSKITTLLTNYNSLNKFQMGYLDFREWLEYNWFEYVYPNHWNCFYETNNFTETIIQFIMTCDRNTILAID